MLVFTYLFLFIQTNPLPKGFCYVKEIIPSIRQELRYCSHNNFIGRTVNSYEKEVLITSTKTALALKKVQKELLEQGLSLKIFDAYRPQSAVNNFVAWARVPDDTLTKKDFYPYLKKRNLFKLGYIASRSGHSRGSSVDLTIVSIADEQELDMGSPFDFFGDISSTYSNKITKKQLGNRLLLRKMMIKHGFKPYSKEWWHFTLRNEPFPKTYFNFPIR